MEIIEIDCKRENFDTELYMLFGDKLVKVTHYGCAANIETAISEYFTCERDTVWYYNTSAAYHKFLKEHGYKRLSGRRKNELYKLVLAHFGV